MTFGGQCSCTAGQSKIPSWNSSRGWHFTSAVTKLRVVSRVTKNGWNPLISVLDFPTELTLSVSAFRTTAAESTYFSNWTENCDREFDCSLIIENLVSVGLGTDTQLQCDKCHKYVHKGTYDLPDPHRIGNLIAKITLTDLLLLVKNEAEVEQLNAMGPYVRPRKPRNSFQFWSWSDHGYNHCNAVE